MGVQHVLLALIWFVGMAKFYSDGDTSLAVTWAVGGAVWLAVAYLRRT